VATASEPLSIIDMLLQEQQQLTAVEEFSQQYEHATQPAAATQYQRLMPATEPGPGQQYAFEVNLDDCSGCKSCVAACHNLNGLETGEMWRNVGMLHGGSASSPALQHVTTACHHCIEPACAHGCPVNAYEKDPITGIVQHLDDQCIGCQYCVFKCPYDVPVYSHAKGIVRKCDMCTGRLAAGEAPACVQSCPNEAISIRIVDQQAVLDDTQGGQFLPGAPSPGYTVPTTIYKTAKPLPRNMMPADSHASRPQHAHWALIWMLVMTQLSAGAFAVEHVLQVSLEYSGGAAAAGVSASSPLRLATSLLLGMAGLAAAVFHLGRPFYAFRAMLGLRRSWLSREILAFNVFAACACADVTVAAAGWAGFAVPPAVVQLARASATVSGIVAVFCSVMIYADTQRAYWNFAPTLVKFMLTAVMLGIPLSLLVSLAGAAFAGGQDFQQIMPAYGSSMCLLLATASVVKYLVEASIFQHLFDRENSPLKRTSLLLMHALRKVTIWRFVAGAAGGIVLPLILSSLSSATLAALPGAVVALLVAAMLALLLAGEVIERYLFFAAVVAPKMPGAPTS